MSLLHPPTALAAGSPAMSCRVAFDLAQSKLHALPAILGEHVACHQLENLSNWRVNGRWHERASQHTPTQSKYCSSSYLRCFSHQTTDCDTFAPSPQQHSKEKQQKTRADDPSCSCRCSWPSFRHLPGKAPTSRLTALQGSCLNGQGATVPPLYICLEPVLSLHMAGR